MGQLLSINSLEGYQDRFNERVNLDRRIVFVDHNVDQEAAVQRNEIPKKVCISSIWISIINKGNYELFVTSSCDIDNYNFRTIMLLFRSKRPQTPLLASQAGLSFIRYAIFTPNSLHSQRTQLDPRMYSSVLNSRFPFLSPRTSTIGLPSSSHVVKQAGRGVGRPPMISGHTGNSSYFSLSLATFFSLYSLWPIL